MRNKILKISIKSLLLIFGIWGLCLTFFGKGFMSASALLYFTIQSNITIMIITAFFLIADIIELKTHKTFINNNWKIVKFVFTVAILITFLVFFIILAPVMPIKYLLSMNNLTVHFFVPILALIDMVLFDNDVKFKKNQQLLAISMPLYYVIFAFILSFSGVKFGGEKVPYYFMNYEKFGWFSISSKGIGVVYWIAILVIAIIGLIYLLSKILKVINKKMNKKSSN